MINVESASELKNLRAKFAEKTVGFVPTMGALHEGHQSLIQLALSTCDVVIVSIFVNPTQFAPHEDFNQYPRTLETDLKKCNDWGVDIVFTPTSEDLYPDTYDAHYKPDFKLATIMCGKTRTHFFYGVCNVVERLFRVVKPTHAVFGDKDFQQRMIIQEMINELNLNIHLIIGDTIRDENGLALSSRNTYLNQDDYQKALTIFKTLHDLEINIQNKEWQSFQARQFVAAQLEGRGLKGDYVEIFRPSTKSLVNGDIQKGDYCCVAAFCGEIRLIDNRKLNL